MTARIDSHQHFWKYDAREYRWIDERMSVLKRDFLPADLEPPLRAAGFGACVTVQARQTLDETAWLLDGTGLSLLVKFTHRVFGLH